MTNNYDEILNFEEIAKEHTNYMRNSINLIASENVTSVEVTEAVATDFAHRYAEGQAFERFYEGCQYIDLIEDRQAAVEAVLDAGHIPAGMELFKSGKRQMETIKKWIDKSDVYMLILGGRYGSIEPESGKSYTHLEYEYALSKNMPMFAVVIGDAALKERVSTRTAMGEEVNNIVEVENYVKYCDFKRLVLSNISGFFTGVTDIKLEVHRQINDIEKQNDLSGWIRGKELVEGLNRLKKENSRLLETIKQLEIKKKNVSGEDENKLKIILTKIIPSLTKYYSFYINLYKATRSIKVEENEAVLKSLFSDNEKFIEQLRKADLYRDGYMCRPASMEYLMKHGKLDSIPWYECWIIENVEFLNKIREFEKSFNYIFDVDLCLLINNLVNKIEPLNSLGHMFNPSMTGIDSAQMDYRAPIEILFEAYKIEEVLVALRDFMGYVQIKSEIDILSIPLSKLTNNGTAPNLGDAL